MNCLLQYLLQKNPNKIPIHYIICYLKNQYCKHEKCHITYINIQRNTSCFICKDPSIQHDSYSLHVGIRVLTRSALWFLLLISNNFSVVQSWDCARISWSALITLNSDCKFRGQEGDIEKFILQIILLYLGFVVYSYCRDILSIWLLHPLDHIIYILGRRTYNVHYSYHFLMITPS